MISVRRTHRVHRSWVVTCARGVSLVACLACVGTRAETAQAQGVRRIVLPAADGELDDGFSRVRAVRELADGRTLVTDDREGRLLVVSWADGSIRQIGREGDGPGEYRSVFGAFALGRDSTLVEDHRAGRWLLLDGARVASTSNYAATRGRVLPELDGADARGLVLAIRPSRFGRSPGVPHTPIRAHAESLVVLLEQRTSGRIDTIAHLRGSFRALREVRKPLRPGGNPVPWTVNNPLDGEDQALLFPDGWIAIAAREPYRVEWRTPDGRRVRGAPLPFTRVPVDDRQKRAAIAARYGPAAGFSPADMPPWPAALPPFLDDALLVGPGGALVIRRTPDAMQPGTHYDVVDRRGVLTGRISVRANERIVGFGARSVYVVATDEDDLQWLRRHPWR